TGRGAAGVKNARDRVAALAPRLVFEPHAEVEEVDDPRRGVAGKHVDSARPAEAAPRQHRVAVVQLGRITRSERRRDTALSEIAGRRDQPAFRQHEHVRLGCRAERGVEAGDAGSDDDEICRSFAHSRFLTDSLKLVAKSTTVTDREAKTRARPRPTHVVLAVILQFRRSQLQVLLWERAKEPAKGAWSLPGGYLEPEETLQSSVRRHLA